MSRSRRDGATLSFAALLSAAEDATLPEVILAREVAKGNLTAADIWESLSQSLVVMKEAVASGLKKTELSPSGLSGGDAARLYRSPHSILGEVGKRAAAYALATAEVNASMGRIVAAPTAGSSGVLPGVLLALSEVHLIDDEQLVRALVVAGGIGQVVSARATLAGAEGGCQAECGAAAAMAAGATVFLLGGDTEAVFHGAAMAITNLLGLVCDPVAGLVEVPCIARNAGASAIALLSAELALSGIRSLIPPDEVVDAMREVGRLLPASLRETAVAGLANTPTARALEKNLLGRQ
ncbi:MAG: L-serine ammonia-lyase, iron-sulfur-dependent, subunit alpha [Dethiobacter sp.]|nr:L-serine ammonia-lyase, iron-sulfur-dependent, subunit alpha [Dethiobacter sp.]